MMFAAEPGKSQLSFADAGSPDAVYRAISNRFRNAAIPDSFWGITERKRFINLILGLQAKETQEYATYLREQMVESSLPKAEIVALYRLRSGSMV